MSLFKKRKPKATVFVDFEHWCYSLYTLYGQRPQIDGFYSSLKESFDPVSIKFFGKFDEPNLKKHLEEIRRVTIDVIETQNPSLHPKKDYTDFIMLDHIYRSAEKRDKCDVYVIFSGDGHFSSVVGYLKNVKKKKVFIYGIRGSVSENLKAIADGCVEIPANDDPHAKIWSKILGNLEHLQLKRPGANATFKSTVSAVSGFYHIDRDSVAASLNELISKDIVIKSTVEIEPGKEISVLSVNWELAEAQGIWTRKKDAAEEQPQK